MWRTGNRSTAGITLLELVVAVAVLSVGLAGVLTALGRILEGANQAALSAQANLLAEQVLGSMEIGGAALGGARISSGESGRFRWATQVVRPDSQKPLEVWTATVTWVVRGQDRSMSLSRVWHRLQSAPAGGSP